MSEITITIESSGDLTFLDMEAAQAFKELGTARTRRASHVEPYAFWPRLAFRVIRMVVSDDSPAASRTRFWGVDWRVNTRPVGGPILRWRHVCKSTVPYPDVIYRFAKREDAIAAEIEFLDKYFLEKK
jgi:hypothetical protein